MLYTHKVSITKEELGKRKGLEKCMSPLNLCPMLWNGHGNECNFLQVFRCSVCLGEFIFLTLTLSIPTIGNAAGFW